MISPGSLLLFFGTAFVFLHYGSAAYVMIHMRPAGGGEEQKTCGFWGSHDAIPSNLTFKSVNTSLSSQYVCSSPGNDTLTGQYATVARGNCTFLQKAQSVEAAGGIGVVVLSDYKPTGSPSVAEHTIPVVLVYKDSFLDIQESISSSSALELGLSPYTPPDFDGSSVLLSAMALLVVVIGSLWSAQVRLTFFKEHVWKTVRERQAEAEREERSEGQGEEEAGKEEAKGSSALGICWALGMVVGMVGFILLLYYFFNVMVWFVIVMFVIGSSTALATCLSALVQNIPAARCTVSMERVPCVRTRVSVATLVLFALSLSFAVTWCVLRHESYAWVMQDILGMAFCLQILQKLRLGTLKVCSVLLCILIVYDVFFVFITPYLTKNHRSIMVDIATGHGADKDNSGRKEMLPILLRSPKLSSDGSAASCFARDYSVLGLGDVIIPGLWVACCAGYDLIMRTPWRLYFLVNCIGYAVGLVICHVALYLMETGQPALLYLVPALLLATLPLAYCRRDLPHMWSGDIPTEKIGWIIAEMPDGPSITNPSTNQEASSATGDTAQPTSDVENVGQNGVRISSTNENGVAANVRGRDVVIGSMASLSSTENEKAPLVKN